MNRPLTVTINKVKKGDYPEIEYTLSELQSSSYYICEYVFENILDFQTNAFVIQDKVEQLFASNTVPNDCIIAIIIFDNDNSIGVTRCFYDTIIYNIKNNINWIKNTTNAINYVYINDKENN